LLQVNIRSILNKLETMKNNIVKGLTNEVLSYNNEK
jgi:hypothetical protein